MKLADVYDALGADTEQRSVLDKKLKGQYDKDCELLDSMLPLTVAEVAFYPQWQDVHQSLDECPQKLFD